MKQTKINRERHKKLYKMKRTHSSDSVTTENLMNPLKCLTSQNGLKWQKGTNQLTLNSIVTHSTSMELKGKKRSLWPNVIKTYKPNVIQKQSTERRKFYKMIYNKEIAHLERERKKEGLFQYTQSYTCALFQFDVVDPAFKIILSNRSEFTRSRHPACQSKYSFERMQSYAFAVLIECHPIPMLSLQVFR